MKLRLLALLLALSALVLCLPATALEAGVSRLTVTVWGDPATARGFAWYTPAGVSGSDLQVVADRGRETDYSAPTRFEGRSGLSDTDAAVRWHKAQATGLSPATAYRFRVGEAASGLWSPWGSFETAGPGGLTFIALTDTQAASARDARISAGTLAVARATAPQAAFVVHSGDVVDAGLDESLWQMTLDAAQDSLLHTTLAPAAGNHERSGGAFYSHFNLSPPPEADTATGAYYSFSWGPVHVVTLNTNEPSGAVTFLSDAQVAWLRQDIQDARAAGALRVVVNVHKGMYSLGAYAADTTVTGKTGLRTRLAPILEELGVDLVLQGHDHFPSRTHPLRGGEAARLGTTYLNTGTAGVKSYKRSEDVGAGYLGRFDFISATAPQYTRYQNFAVITVDARGNMSGVLYEIDQQEGPQSPYEVDRFHLPTPVARLGGPPFEDIGDGEALAPAVAAVYAAGIMDGVGEGRFDPDTPTTRAMLVTLLHRLAGLPAAPGAGFRDVPAGQWYSAAVAWAASEGYVSGYGDGRFGPLDRITRQQLAAVLYRYAAAAGRAVPGAALTGYSDADTVSAYARDAVAWALAAGVLAPQGSALNPRGTVSRGDAAVAMAAMLALQD